MTTSPDRIHAPERPLRSPAIEAVVTRRSRRARLGAAAVLAASTALVVLGSTASGHPGHPGHDRDHPWWGAASEAWRLDPWLAQPGPNDGTQPEERAGAVREAPDRMVPSAFSLSPEVREALEQSFLTDDERADLALFHGLVSADLLNTPLRQVRHAINIWSKGARPAEVADLPIEELASWHLRRGEIAMVFAVLDGEAVPSVAGRRIRAEALASIGRYPDAMAELDRIAPMARGVMERENPAEMTELARARVLDARLRGASATEYNAIVALLAQVHQQVDRLHWPALVVEADLLASKRSFRDAVAAYQAALALNPIARDAWYGLGRIAVMTFNFDGARVAADAIRRGAPDHPYADLLEARIRLTQDDPRGALEILEPVVAKYPALPGALTLTAASAAMTYDADAEAAALAAWDQAFPGSPEALAETGRFLSLFRQYERSAERLEQAIERQPNWSEPRLELGLMEMQSGRDDRAIAVLRTAARIDPFNKRLANSLALIEELQEYATIETDHFVIRYRPGEDEVMATMMAEPLEAMHVDIVERFGGPPPVKTVVELMPDQTRFAVRITGMPRFGATAACTGPVIAMPVPRDGLPSMHRGPFDWIRVMRHEYTHTVTLAITGNRIPHWLTEGAAVDEEKAPRSWGDCLMLASAHKAGELFTLDEIKWGFVRPRRPQDRALAYAQAQWMLEFMTERWGEEAVATLMEQYDSGVRESEAVPIAFGVDRDVLYERFLGWAGEQIASWGLAPQPSLRTILAERGARILAERPVEMGPGSSIDNVPVGGDENPGADGPAGVPVDPEGEGRVNIEPTIPVIDDSLITELVAEYPEHPDLLRMDLERRVSAGEPVDADLRDRLLQYARIRPLDPFPHSVLARELLASDEPGAAIPHLEFLDAREQRLPVYARRLAELHRAAGNRDAAVRSAERAVSFDPYDAPNRELAASARIEAGQLPDARMHLQALAILEPDRTLHQRRLDALDRMIGAAAAADAAVDDRATAPVGG